MLMLRSTESAFTAAALVILTVIDRVSESDERAGRTAGSDWRGVMPPVDLHRRVAKTNQLKVRLTRYQAVEQERGHEPQPTKLRPEQPIDIKERTAPFRARSGGFSAWRRMAA
ncbi:hypothetical protein RHECNPAF_1760049 [Rhizobium etli CNPAF512]|nr:hypothetical protein RHECNPAF_1760049 [Rhizobium etli CNPAF512]